MSYWSDDVTIIIMWIVSQVNPPLSGRLACFNVMLIAEYFLRQIFMDA